MIKTIILILAIFFSWTTISNTINSMILILKQGQPRKDAHLDMWFTLLCSILWGIFFYL